MEQPGSFSCSCNPGYRLQPDGRSCNGKELSLCLIFIVLSPVLIVFSVGVLREFSDVGEVQNIFTAFLGG